MVEVRLEMPKSIGKLCIFKYGKLVKITKITISPEKEKRKKQKSAHST